MFNNEIIAQGEKLKRIRQILRATQTDIAQDVCTKNMISQIERDKKKLNFSLATKIAENLNKIASNKKVSLPLITAEELMIDNDESANNIFKNQILNQLKEIKVIDMFDKKLLEAEKQIEKHNITNDKKIEMYKLATNFYYNKRCYLKSDQVSSIGLSISMNSQNDFEVLNFLIYKCRANILVGNYVKALQQLDHADKINNNIVNDDFVIMIFYYKALAYKRLGEYDTALKYFKILMRFNIDDFKMLLKIKIVYANCLNACHRVEESEKEYKETLYIAIQHNDKGFISMAYRNLAELYFNQKDYKIAITYAKESLKHSLNNEYLNEILYFTGKIIQNSNKDAEKYFLQSLEICEKEYTENLNLIEKLIYELVLIYIKKNDKENLMIMADKTKIFNIDYSLIYLEIADYYRDKDKEKSNYFNSKSKEKMKLIKKTYYDKMYYLNSNML